MRRTVFLIALAACGPRAPARATPQEAHPAVPRLLAPPLIDPDVRGAGYLTAVALQLQPAWHQFLEDCRLRLPATHALNQMSLATTAELEIDGRGHLVGQRIAPSGNHDFDLAIGQVIGDASPLPVPPRELWSDDDHVHLIWTFARDRRQAGPATAQVDDVQLPLRGVVDRRIGEHDLARAARRILRAPGNGDRELATQHVMVAALRLALDSSDGVVRRAAIDAIARAHVSELAVEVRQLLTSTSDVELRIAATQASAALADSEAVPILTEQLRADLREQPRLAAAEARALVELGHEAAVKSLLASQLAKTTPSPVALQLLALAPIAELTAQLPSWIAAGDARVRAGVCAALAGYRADVAWPLVNRGLRDRDASVRAACAATSSADHLREGLAKAAAAQRSALGRLRELTRDRDVGVRAQAILALGILDPAHLPDASDDDASDVRAAYATALAAPMPRAVTDKLHALVDDRDPEVRAAAWGTLATISNDAARGALAAHAATDGAAQVRRAAVRAIDDDEILLRLATRDDAAEVRTAAIVQLAGRRGRAATADLLLERLAEAAPVGGERVRTALAWLLAR